MAIYYDSMKKTCDKRLRYTQEEQDRITVLLKRKVSKTETEVIHRAMVLGLGILEEIYINTHDMEGANECRHSA